MNPGLRYLLRKRPVAVWRRIRRRLRGGKGALKLIAIALVVGLIVGPQIMLALITDPDPDAIRRGFDSVRRWGPPAILLMALVGLTSGFGLYFRRTEIDFLFPAPIGRRELLCYHLVGRLLVIFASSLWIAIFTLRHAATWYGGFLALFFALSFINLCGQVSGLLLSNLSVRITRGVKLVLWLAVAAAVVVGLVQLRGSLPAGTDMQAQLATLADSEVARAISLPARPFAELFVADAADVARWAAVCAVILLLVFGTMLFVDVGYTEGALLRSRQIEDRLRRVRSGGGSAVLRPKAGRLRFGRAPWLGGAGPIAWRQMIEIARNLRSVLWTSLMIIGIPVTVIVLFSNGRGGDSAVVMVLVFTVMSPQQAAFDFRREFDRMPMLKSLPIAPSRVALGYVLPTACLIASMQTVALLVVGVLNGLPEWLAPWMIAVLVVPFNWVSVGIDNALFLWFPYRIAPKEAGQPQFMGRLMAVMFAKMFALIAVCGAATLLAWLVSPLGIVASILAAAAVLVTFAALVTVLVGMAFSTFDLTTDLPD